MIIKRGTKLTITKVACSLKEILGDKLVTRVDADKKISGGDKDFVYFMTRAMTADKANTNGDIFLADELKGKYTTFDGRGLYLNHDADCPTKSVGKVVEAYYIDGDPEDIHIVCLCKVDKILYPLIARKVITGIIDSVSMGASCESCECGLCGAKATQESEFCDHLRQLGKKVDYNGTMQIATSINHGFCFNELSLVANPADESAKMLEIIAKSNSVKATEIRKIASELNINLGEVNMVKKALDTKEADKKYYFEEKGWKVITPKGESIEIESPEGGTMFANVVEDKFYIKSKGLNSLTDKEKDLVQDSFVEYVRDTTGLLPVRFKGAAKKVGEDKSDEDIAKEFAGMTVTNVTLYGYKGNDAISGSVELHFPDAGESVGGGQEGESDVSDQFIVYDFKEWNEDGRKYMPKIALDQWYTDTAFSDIQEAIVTKLEEFATKELGDKEACKKVASAYTDFVGKFMKENEGSTMSDASNAWKEQKGSDAKEPILPKEKDEEVKDEKPTVPGGDDKSKPAVEKTKKKPEEKLEDIKEDVKDLKDEVKEVKRDVKELEKIVEPAKEEEKKVESTIKDINGLPLSAEDTVTLKDNVGEFKVVVAEMEGDKGLIKVECKGKAKWFSSKVATKVEADSSNDQEVNGYQIKWNELWEKYQVSHPEIGATIAEFDKIEDAKEYAVKGSVKKAADPIPPKPDDTSLTSGMKWVYNRDSKNWEQKPVGEAAVEVSAKEAKYYDESKDSRNQASYKELVNKGWGGDYNRYLTMEPKELAEVRDRLSKNACKAILSHKKDKWLITDSNFNVITKLPISKLDKIAGTKEFGKALADRVNIEGVEVIIKRLGMQKKASKGVIEKKAFVHGIDDVTLYLPSNFNSDKFDSEESGIVGGDQGDVSFTSSSIKAGMITLQGVSLNTSIGDLTKDEVTDIVVDIVSRAMESVGEEFFDKEASMNSFKITYANGDTVTTGFNGTLEDAKKYYVGNVFNLGSGENDNMVKAISVEQLEDEKKASQDVYEADADALILLIDNTKPMYDKMVVMYKNLTRKKKSGKYDSALARKLFKYLVDEAAKVWYMQQVEWADGGNSVVENVKKEVKEQVAKEMAERFEQEYESKAYDFMEDEKEDKKAEFKPTKQIAYDVTLDGDDIDTVFYTNSDEEEVKKSLVDHDGYDPNIVVKQRANKEAETKEAAFDPNIEHKMDKSITFETAMKMSKEELANLPTLHQGQGSDMKFGDDTNRIWLSRMTVEDGAEEDYAIEYEKYKGNRWVTVDKFGKEASKRGVLTKQASAFDKVEKVDVAEGLFAVKNKETQDIEVKDLDGKVLESFPDAFGDDIVSIIKLLNQVVKTPKDEEAKVKRDKEVTDKTDKELEDLKSALEASKKEVISIKASLESLELKTSLDKRVAECRVLAQTAYDKDVIEVDQKYIEEQVKAGQDIMVVKAEAIKRTIDRQTRDLMRMDDSQIKAFASTLERFHKIASRHSSGKLKTSFVASADLSNLSEDPDNALQHALSKLWSRNR